MGYEEVILAEYSKDMGFVKTANPVGLVKPSDFTKNELFRTSKH